MRSAAAFAAAALVASPIMTSCDDDTSSVGSSLVTDEVEVIIDSLFYATGRTADNQSVMSRTTSHLLGRLEAQEYGRLSSDIVTQFMPAADIDTAGVTLEKIDSVKLILGLAANGFTGDSLVPMGLKVYKLKKQLPSPIFSSFDPKDYYSESDLMGTATYSGNALHSDSLMNTSNRNISIQLPVEFGREIFRRYLSNPETFATPSAFAEWFPGMYIANSFGAGRVINTYAGIVNVYYHLNDTTFSGQTFMALTPEIVSNSNISLEMAPGLKEIAKASPTIVAPAGTEVEVEFPTRALIDNFTAKGGSLAVLNDLTFTIPAEEITNVHNILPPENLLLVLKKDKEKFFSENQIASNSGTSYYATYDSKKKQYNFTGMRSYLLEMLEKETLTAEDSKFVLTAINVQTTQESNGYGGYTTTITGMIPYTSRPAMVKLDIEKAKIKMVMSRQKQ